MGYQIGSGMVGSAAILASVAGQEIVPAGRKFKSFELMNDQACTISVNGDAAFHLRAAQGLSVKAEDFPINSVKITEPAITFNWVAVY